MVAPTGTPQAQLGQVTPPVDPTASHFGTTPAPSEAPKTQADIDRAVHAARSAQGRELADKFRTKELSMVRAGGDAAAEQAVIARQEQERIAEQNETVLLEAQADRDAAKQERADTMALLAGIKADALVLANPGISKTQLMELSKGDTTVMDQLAPMLPKADPNAPPAPAAALPAIPGQPLPLTIPALQPDNNVSVGAGGLSVENLSPQAIKALQPNQLQEALDKTTERAKSHPIATST